MRSTRPTRRTPSRQRRLARLLLPLAALLTACPDEGSPGLDASPDTTADTTTPDTTADTTTPDTTADTTTPDTIIDDGSLEGTFLVNTAVRWTDPLHLCSRWYEGASLEAERAHKVRIAVPTGARAGLTRAALEAATLPTPFIERSPFFADQHRPSASSAVTRWQVQRYDGFDVLEAHLEHGFAGVGTLTERYMVSRDASADPAVRIAEDGVEVTFLWRPDGEPEAHPLGPCASPDELELAVEAIPLSGPNGLEGSLLRFYRTLHSDFSAGSYLVIPVATELQLSDSPWATIRARGFWAHTYVAQHHNWYDNSLVDFRLDLASWQNIFSRLDAGQTIPDRTVSKIELLDVAGDDTGKVRLTRLSPTGTPTSTELVALAHPVRVDGNHLGRSLASGCESPTIGAVGYGDLRAQLAFCPSSSAPEGRALVAVVPIAWRFGWSTVGTVLSGEAITPLSGRPGWTVVIGTGRLVVEPRPDGHFIVDILDAQGQSQSSMWTELDPLEADEGWRDPVHAASSDGEVELRIERLWAAQAAGHSAIFASDLVELRWGERRDVVVAWDAIEYTNTHHNWDDSMSARTLDGLTLHWALSFDWMTGGGFRHVVWVTDEEGETLLPETELIPVPPEK